MELESTQLKFAETEKHSAAFSNDVIIENIPLPLLPRASLLHMVAEIIYNLYHPKFAKDLEFFCLYFKAQTVS